MPVENDAATSAAGGTDAARPPRLIMVMISRTAQPSWRPLRTHQRC